MTNIRLPDGDVAGQSEQFSIFCCHKLVAPVKLALAVCSSFAGQWANAERTLPAKPRSFWRIINIFFVMVAANLCWQSPILAQNYPAYNNAYDHSSGPVANYPDWMSHLDDNDVLATLSIPGTHDSGTYTGGGGDIAQTQSMSIANQLQSGIRFLDIRLRYMNPSGSNCSGTFAGAICAAPKGDCTSLSSGCDLWVFHGDIFMNVNFKNDVLTPVINFLTQHPTEVVIMRIAKESGANSDTSDLVDPMQQLSANYDDNIVPNYCSTGQGTGVSNGLPVPSRTSVDSFPPNPPLRLGPTNSLNPCDARGKIIILPQYWGATPASFAFYDFYSLVVGQTNDTQAYGGGTDNLSSNFDLYNKWTNAESFFNLVNTTAPKYYNGIFYANQLNGSGGGFPYFFASGQSDPVNGAPLLATGLTTPGFASSYPDFPRIDCFIGICTIAFEGMNQLTAEYLNGIPFADGNQFIRSLTNWNTVGIVTADFPGKDLIAAIANVNSFVPGLNLLAGTPGQPNCKGDSVSTLAQQYGGLAHAATALGFSSVRDLQNAIAVYCGG